MFAITAHRIIDNQTFNIWFGGSRNAAVKALARLTAKYRGVYVNFQIVERAK